MLGMRNMMLTVLDEDYITVAQAKGMPNSRVLWRYAARNAVLPQIQSFALSLGFIVGGTVVMEMVFSYPGVGKMLLDATNAKASLRRSPSAWRNRSADASGMSVCGMSKAASSLVG